MLKQLAACLVALVVAVPLWAADNKTDAKGSDADKAFAEKAWMGNMAEIKMGQMAAKMATRDDVKAYAKMLADDHTKANQKLKDVLGKKNITLGNTEPKDLKEHMDKLSSSKGADFDAAYLRDMVEDHEKDIKLYEDYIKNATDSDLKGYATTVLPTIKEHLEMAKKLAAQKTEK